MKESVALQVQQRIHCTTPYKVLVDGRRQQGRQRQKQHEYLCAHTSCRDIIGSSGYGGTLALNTSETHLYVCAARTGVMAAVGGC